MLTTLIFLEGCSYLIAKEKIKIVVPVKKKFVEIKVDEFLPLGEIEKIDLAGLIDFVDESNSSVKMSVSTWLIIREINIKKDRAIKRLKVQREIYKKAYKGYELQIIKHGGF